MGRPKRADEAGGIYHMLNRGAIALDHDDRRGSFDTNKLTIGN